MAGAAVRSPCLWPEGQVPAACWPRAAQQKAVLPGNLTMKKSGGPQGDRETLVLPYTFLMSFSCLCSLVSSLVFGKHRLPSLVLCVCVAVRGGRGTVSDKGPVRQQEVALGRVLQN